ncbi:PEP-CTERM sorting domain-containing protein [Stieleria varia]|uniref:Ice-binding protein C-terminal domain-containing protein n=1 Tax=Stieleria varia TaxID=2528005 RepID=A0A5C5ZVX1_9BACT|nr:PEP-CTERM sorting domain-containing protein [Stieleria varia]TWT91732.1 hypothetical protein Pla52n_64810 [Stieleria varia]
MYKYPLALIAVPLLAFLSASQANAAITFRFSESTPGSDTVVAGIGGRVTIGLYATSDELDVQSIDSFDLYIDMLGDGNVADPVVTGFVFANPAVTAGAIFSNSTVNPANAFTIPVANADLQVSADRELFNFTATPTKLFDLNIDVASTVAAGNYSIAFRDDSGALAAVNNTGNNLLFTQPAQIQFLGGTISVVSAVPEPTSFSLLALTGVVCLIRRRRK